MSDWAHPALAYLVAAALAPLVPNGLLRATLLLLVATMLPGALGAAGMVYLVGAAFLSLAFTIPAFSFNAAPNDERARRLFLASVAWVPGFFALVVVDLLVR